MGKILQVSLSNGDIAVLPLDEKIAQKYIVGSGLAAEILYKATTAHTSSLSPLNPLVFMTEPFTGTRIPTSGRHCIASRSLLTGIWGESDVGGSWGLHLKKAGFDGIVVI